MRGERPASEVYELEMRLTDGRALPTLVAISVIRDDDGKPQGVTGLVLDVSERKELEAALQAERDRLHAILTNIGDAVMVTDIEGPNRVRQSGLGAHDRLPCGEAAGRAVRL